MNRQLPPIALLYEFDKALCTKDMQKQTGFIGAENYQESGDLRCPVAQETDADCQRRGIMYFLI